MSALQRWKVISCRRTTSPLAVSSVHAYRTCEQYSATPVVGMQATEDKNTAMAQAEKTAGKAALAERLISNLAGENQRWNASIHEFAAAEGAP